MSPFCQNSRLRRKASSPRSLNLQERTISVTYGPWQWQGPGQVLPQCIPCSAASLAKAGFPGSSYRYLLSSHSPSSSPSCLVNRDSFVGVFPVARRTMLNSISCIADLDGLGTLLIQAVHASSFSLLSGAFECLLPSFLRATLAPQINPPCGGLAREEGHLTISSKPTATSLRAAPSQKVLVGLLTKLFESGRSLAYGTSLRYHVSGSPTSSCCLVGSYVDPGCQPFPVSDASNEQGRMRLGHFSPPGSERLSTCVRPTSRGPLKLRKHLSQPTPKRTACAAATAQKLEVDYAIVGGGRGPAIRL